MKKILLFCLGAVILFSGCGSFYNPSEQMAKDAVTAKGLRGGPGFDYTVLEFEKTNGQRSVENGVVQYEIWFRVKIKFNSDRLNEMFNPYFGYKWRAGDTRVTTGSCTFDMTDNGWRVKDISMLLF